MKNLFSITSFIVFTTLILFTCEADIVGISDYDKIINDVWLIESLNGTVPQACAADDTYDFQDEGPLVIHYQGTPCYNNPDESQDAYYSYNNDVLILKYALGPFTIDDTLDVVSVTDTKLILENDLSTYILVR